MKKYAENGDRFIIEIESTEEITTDKAKVNLYYIKGTDMTLFEDQLIQLDRLGRMPDGKGTKDDNNFTGIKNARSKGYANGYRRAEQILKDNGMTEALDLLNRHEPF